jgi:threonine/homoserine/homoserine lactone efflux protein
MGYSDIFSYSLSLIAIALAPGPVALVLLVRAASKDVWGAFGFAVGFGFGGLIIISAVCFGLGAWLTQVPQFLEYSSYIMMAYILWLAIGIWRGKFDMSCGTKAAPGSFLGSVGAGVATCFISPYMMILFPLVLPDLMDIKTIEMPEFLVVAALTFMSLLAGSTLIIAFAAQIGRLVKSDAAMRVMNRTLACLLVMGGGWMAIS